MRKILTSLALVLSLFLLGGVALAADGAPAPKKDDGWEQVDGGMMQPGETIPANRLVAGAYGFIFAAVLVWVASVTARSRRVEEELEDLRKKLEQKAK